MTQLSILFLVAAIAFGIAKWLRLPQIPLLLISGFLISQFGFEPSTEFLQTLVTLGLAFLVFSAGIEFTPSRVHPNSRAVLMVSVSQFVVIGITGYAVAILMGFRGVPALYLACAVCASSTLVGLRHLTERKQRFEPFARLVLGTLLVQDLIMIVLIVVLVRLPYGAATTLAGVGAAALVGGLAFFCQKWALRRFILRMRMDAEALLLSILAVLFIFVAIAVNLRLPAVAGAFLAGFALSSFPVNGLVRGVLNPLTDFFIAIFFTGLGALLVLPQSNDLITAFLLALVVVVLTPALVTLVAEWNGYSSRAAIDSGLLLAQTSEFSIVLALAGLGSDQITQDEVSIIALITVFTMILTPFIARDRVTQWLLRLHPNWRRLSPEEGLTGHILLLGFGAGGMWVVKPLLAENYRVVVVDDDPVVVAQLQRAGIECIRGDGSDEQVLRRAGAGQARLVLAAMRRIGDADKVLRHVNKQVPVVVRVFEKEEAELIEQLGGTPILNSMAAADRFLEWFEANGYLRATEQSEFEVKS